MSNYVLPRNERYHVRHDPGREKSWVVYRNEHQPWYVASFYRKRRAEQAAAYLNKVVAQDSHEGGAVSAA